ncbi:cystinosin homolog [Procambarus clarkii]|uniref:cystinosin homolog n=1 Tax=Procambarus clarkii TaxID=6728 RepID=UPI0037431B89
MGGAGGFNTALTRPWGPAALLLLAAASTSAEGQTVPLANASLAILPHEVDLQVGDHFTLNLTLSGEFEGCVNVSFQQTKEVVDLPPPLLLCDGSQGDWWDVVINTTYNGKATLTAQVDPPGVVESRDAFALVSVMTNPSIDVAADVLGWLYTIAWDVSFLPQIYRNWHRKSVMGLSFDFLTLNFIGFSSYFIFNMGLFWIDEIQAEYFLRHPRSVLHVRLNDVIFPLYAVLCTAVQIIQCFFLQRGPGQRVSITCRVIASVMVVSEVVGCILVPLVDSILWLDLLYYLSYIKLAVTCIKYFPQLWENYRQQNTEGWSIWQVILDFTGGSLSLLQMFLLAGNYDDWFSVLTDPAKLGLGLVSVLFDIMFFIQHYCLYRHPGVKANTASSLQLVGNDDMSQSGSYVTHHL